jgi:phenylacetate-CoA ligase
LVFKEYQVGLDFRRKSINWSAEQKSAWQLNALRRSVRDAAAGSNYYKHLFERIGFDPQSNFGFDEFSSLPVLNREDVAGEELISSHVSNRDRLMDSTGGSTGSPTIVWKGPEERGWLESGIQFAFERIGVRQGDRMAFLWGHHLDPKASDSTIDRLTAFLRNERYFDCFRLSAELFADYHLRFEKYAPDCIVAYASALGQLGEFLLENRIKPRNYPKKCFVTGAEKLMPQHREAIESVFGPGRPVHERYGGRDFGAVAIQTKPNHSMSLDVDWAWAIVEPETCDRQSPILVTKLHADAMPMIRYRVGDIAKFPASSQPGHPAFWLEEVIGRNLDGIWLTDGRWIHGNELPHLLKDFPVREFSLVQEKDYEVFLRLVPKRDFTDDHMIEIKRVLLSNLENLSVNVSVVESIERTRAFKWRPVSTKVER